MATPDTERSGGDGPAAERNGHPSTPAAVSKRRLMIGVCLTIVAIAFEAIAVATAMPVAARELDGLDWYAWSFSLFVIGMLFATVVGGRLPGRVPGAARGPDRAGEAAARRPGRLRRRPGGRRHCHDDGAAGRRPLRPGSGRRRAE